MKDYKKILEGVMNIINTTEKSDIGFVNICTYISENCPELKESEDERIKMEIIEYIKIGTYRKDWIAWLEKQGEQILANSEKTCKDEQKPVPKFEVGDVMRTLQEAADNITSGLPVVVSIDDEYYYCTNELIAIKDQDDYEYPPMNRMQKSWGEEEEKQRRQIERIVSNAGCTKNLQEKIHNWFGSLKDRVQPQQEWSKEDKKLIDDTCHLINTLASGYGEKVTEPITFSGTQMIASIKDRLRALVENRPQNRWKPSDEQIEALDIAIRAGIQLGSWEEEALRELQKQLKAL